MTAPTFVGLGSQVSSGSSWSTALTVTSSALPAGVLPGDRLVMFLSVSYTRQLFPTVDPNYLNAFNGVSSWTAITPASFSYGYSTTSNLEQLWAYTTKYNPSLFPFTLVPIGAPSGTTYDPTTYSIYGRGIQRVSIAVWRPSAASGGHYNGTSFNNYAYIPQTQGSVSITNANGLAVAVAALPGGGTIGTLSTANGFAIRGTVSGAQGVLSIADKAPGVTGSVNGPYWNKPFATAPGPSGVSMLIAFNDPDPALTPGWIADRNLIASGAGWT